MLPPWALTTALTLRCSGMQYRKNFVHHSLEVPGLHGRGGIYFDGHQQATSNVTLNVAYKAAGRAFLVNGGAKTNVTRNVSTITLASCFVLS